MKHVICAREQNAYKFVQPELKSFTQLKFAHHTESMSFPVDSYLLNKQRKQTTKFYFSLRGSRTQY